MLSLKKSAEREIAVARDQQELESVRTLYLGRSGQLTSILRQVGTLSPEERPEMGKLANEIKRNLEEQLAARLRAFGESEKEQALASEQIDVTLPGRRVPVGRKHPITLVFEEIRDIFERLGFEVAQGPEMESDYYNFEALNIPRDHPARDMQDTFYLNGELLLRTHTSPMQVRVMEVRKPPLAVICPGAVYRRDSDLSHTPMFHQVEGLVVDEDVSFPDLKSVLTIFVHHMFGEKTALRFRPSYFPFTEPSAEVDIRCVICQGTGCRVCSEKGWLEILGAGMVHPQVFRMVGYDPEVYTGYAFGLGVERVAMLKFGINDIRLFFENDLRFIRQFS